MKSLKNGSHRGGKRIPLRSAVLVHQGYEDAVKAIPALDQAALLQREQDVLEKLLGNRVVLGEIADEHGT